MSSISAFGGWLLQRAVEIDEHWPGFAGSLFRCSVERRHVVAAYLSLDEPKSGPQSTRELGEFLLTGTNDDILRAAFGSLPDGLRGALGRSSRQPFPRRFYAYLYAMMHSSARPETKRMIVRLSRISPAHLRIARALPLDLQIASLVEALEDIDDARALTTLVKLLSESGVERADLRRALKSVTSREGLHRFAMSWAFRAVLPRHPVTEADFYAPITSGADLRRLALRHRNCARSHLANVLDSYSAFALVRDGKTEAVVHLVRHDQKWHLDQIYGPGNSRPDSVLAARAIDHLSRHGIVLRRQSQRSPSPWDALRRLCGYANFQAEPDEF